MEFLVLSNFQIFLIILSDIVLIIFTLVNNRSKNIPTDTEAFNYALKALVDGDKDKAYNLLRDIISKDSNNIDAYLLLGDIVREKDENQAIKINTYNQENLNEIWSKQYNYISQNYSMDKVLQKWIYVYKNI